MDPDVLKRVAAGDKRAMAEMYQEYFPGAWRYIFSKLLNKEIAEDVVSEGFIKLFEAAANIKNPAATKSYFYRILKNLMYTKFKEKQNINTSELAIEISAGVEVDENLDFEMPAETEENETNRKVVLEELLSQLADEQQDVLRLNFLSGLKLIEVAEILDKSEANIKVIKHRALKKLKNLININI